MGAHPADYRTCYEGAMTRALVLVMVVASAARADVPNDVGADPDRYVEQTPFVGAPRTTTPEGQPPPETAPISLTASGFVAGYGYSHHPTRKEGVQTQVRGDVWSGLDWGAHLTYTMDVIQADDGRTGSYSPHSFHDLDGGGSFDLGLGIPMWVFGELHVLGGSTDYGAGAALFGGLGIYYRKFEVELGTGVLMTSGDVGLTTSLHASRSKITPWLGAGMTLLYTHDTPTTAIITTGGRKLAGGPELTFGPFDRFLITVDALFGTRTFAILQRGRVVENQPDVERTMIRMLGWITLTERLRGYVGWSYRTATAMQDYKLLSGFAGAVFNF